MARQAINIGSSANDGTGDPLRTAFDKINDNFVELYGTDNDINTLDANLDVNTFAITTGVTNGDITVTPNGTGGIKLRNSKIVSDTVELVDAPSQVALDPTIHYLDRLKRRAHEGMIGIRGRVFGSSRRRIATARHSRQRFMMFR